MNVSADASILQRTASRYRACGRFTRHYVASKLRRDPVHAALLALGRREHLGEVADLGCGRGQIGVALLEAEVAHSVVALDCSTASVADVQKAAAGLSLTGFIQDLTRLGTLPSCDTVLLIDVLYMLGAPSALSLLRAAAAAARQRMVIRTLDPDLGVRSVLTRTTERLGRRLWPHSGAHVDPISIAALTTTLREAGFSHDGAVPCWQGTPFAECAYRRAPDDPGWDYPEWACIALSRVPMSPL